jgi:RNA polymerase sigma factor (TIGR02999 family)
MGDVTQLLEQTRANDDHQLRSELFTHVYAELRKLAATCLRPERPDHTLQPTALVAEAYLRLTSGTPVSWESRAHFFGVAGRAMRQILVEHARARKALKRGGDFHRLELDDSIACAQNDPARTIAIDAALARLADLDARAAQVVELRFFAGLTVDEVAGTIGLSAKTVKRDWEFARVWLERELRDTR